jgi:hypothetical protein
MLGANLVSVQKLLGHSDPKITERRYGHLLPDFMRAEVNRLQVRAGGARAVWQRFAAFGRASPAGSYTGVAVGGVRKSRGRNPGDFP